MTPRPATTTRHLAMLDELAELGMVLARRCVDLPPRPGQDIGLDFERASRAVRRAILLSQAIINGNLPAPPVPRPEPDHAPDRHPSDRERSDAGTRLDPLDRLDSFGPSFQATVAAIVSDIRTVLASVHPPREPAPRGAAPSCAGAIPDRPEADAADLK